MMVHMGTEPTHMVWSVCEAKLLSRIFPHGVTYETIVRSDAQCEDVHVAFTTNHHEKQHDYKRTNQHEDCGGCCKLVGGITRLRGAKLFFHLFLHRGSDVARLLEQGVPFVSASLFNKS